MSVKQIVLLTVAVVIFFAMGFFIIFGNNGLADLRQARKEHDHLVEKNQAIRQENVILYREIDRMNHDPYYLEEVARKELGVIGPGEVVIRMKNEQEKKK